MKIIELIYHLLLNIIMSVFISFIVFPVLSVTQSATPTDTPSPTPTSTSNNNNQLPVVYIGIGVSLAVVVVSVTLILLLILIIRIRKKDVKRKIQGKYEDSSSRELYVIQINGILLIFA